MEINKDFIGKKYKDRLSGAIFTVVRGYKIVDDLGNTKRIFYETIGNIGGIISTHTDVSGITILRNLIKE